MAILCQTNSIKLKGKLEFRFWDSGLSPADPLSSEISVTGENYTYKKNPAIESLWQLS